MQTLTARSWPVRTAAAVAVVLGVAAAMFVPYPAMLTVTLAVATSVAAGMALWPAVRRTTERSRQRRAQRWFLHAARFAAFAISDRQMGDDSETFGASHVWPYILTYTIDGDAMTVDVSDIRKAWPYRATLTVADSRQQREFLPFSTWTVTTKRHSHEVATGMFHNGEQFTFANEGVLSRPVTL